MQGERVLARIFDIFWRKPQGAPTELPPTVWERAERLAIWLLPWIIVITLVGVTVLLLTPDIDRVSRADEKLLAVGMAALFAALAVLFLARLIGSLESGESLGVESHWGGLGGGVGGWRVSRAAVYLICTATFAALAAVAMSTYRRSEPVKPSPNAASSAGAKQQTTTAQETTTAAATDTTASTGTTTRTQAPTP
jgi:uncharacterized membrane protein